MKDLQEKIDFLLEDHENRTTDFQIKHFIVKGEGDTFAQYRQALREIEARRGALAKKVSQLRRNKSIIDNHDKLLIQTDVQYKNMRQRSIAEYNRELRKAKMTRAELEQFVSLALKLKNEIGDLDPEKRAQLEAESWKAHGLKLAALDLLSTGRLQVNTVEFILALPKKDMADVLKQISSKPPLLLAGVDDPELIRPPKRPERPLQHYR